MLRRTLTVWTKELRDTLRDRRTLAVMVLAPVLLMPVFMLVPQALLGRQMRQGQAPTFAIAVHGAAHGPQLVSFMEQAGATIEEVTGDPAAIVRDDSSKVVLVIPPDLEARMAAEQPVELRIVGDNTNLGASGVAERVLGLVLSFGQQVAAERLAARGLDATIIRPLEVQRENVATEQQMGGSFLGMFVPLYVILFAFLGGMYAAIDTTAGEKERGTLEPLLTAPIRRGELVTGKVLAVFVTSFGATVLSLLSTYLTFRFAPGDPFARGMSFVLSIQQVLWLMAVALPLTLLLSGLEMVICIFARSFKEAQNYVTPLQLLLMLPALAVGFISGLQVPAATYALPAVGQVLVCRDILSGNPLNGAHLALSLGSASAYALLAIAVAVRTFRSEGALFRT